MSVLEPALSFTPTRTYTGNVCVGVTFTVGSADLQMDWAGLFLPAGGSVKADITFGYYDVSTGALISSVTIPSTADIGTFETLRFAYVMHSFTLSAGKSYICAVTTNATQPYWAFVQNLQSRGLTYEIGVYSPLGTGSTLPSDSSGFSGGTITNGLFGPAFGTMQNPATFVLTLCT